MTGNVASIVEAYGAAWLEEDAAKRMALLQTAWSDDGVYQDPTADCVGRQALSDHIGGFHKGARGARIVLTSGVDVQHAKVRFTCRMIGADGATVIEGTDFGTLAADALARHGVRVKILERDEVYQDRVRGEFMAPWGVRELANLGLRDVLVGAGAIQPRRFIPYDENYPSEGGDERAAFFAEIAPHLPDPICMGHPEMCESLIQAAMAACADVSRGVASVNVEAGARPTVSYKFGGEQIARCKPVSRFHAYSNEDHWVDVPVARGAVLIGDAAGHCDPATGQGLSLALRDVRILRDILAKEDWSISAFVPYVEERRERMRRTRVEGYPSPMGSGFVGPEVKPAECFEQSAVDVLLAP